MYRPEYSQNPDSSLALDRVRDFPLGLLISSDSDSNVVANYYPFFLKVENGQNCLITHMARSNPQWKHLNDRKITVSFLGPSHYISPSIYVNKLNVPTWNYCAVQIHGTSCTVQDPDEMDNVLSDTVDHFEKINQSDWTYDLPKQFKANLTAAIVGVKIHILEIESKFKLSQNRSNEDYSAVVDHFQKQKTDVAKSLVRWMKLTCTQERNE